MINFLSHRMRESCKESRAKEVTFEKSRPLLGFSPPAHDGGGTHGRRDLSSQGQLINGFYALDPLPLRGN
jgi:hypothetical protein